MEPKHLVLLRHAKSSWDDPNLADHDRPLNRRGQRAATSVGHYFRTQGILPDLVLCSSALRTRQTVQLLQLAPHVEVLIEDGLYGTGPGELLARLRGVGDAVTSLLVVGHNPTIQELAITLTDDQERLQSFPTAALADLRIPVATWAGIGPTVATLDRFVTPESD
jgi:phosphohistidine phosphatase